MKLALKSIATIILAVLMVLFQYAAMVDYRGQQPHFFILTMAFKIIFVLCAVAMAEHIYFIWTRQRFLKFNGE